MTLVKSNGSPRRLHRPVSLLEAVRPSAVPAHSHPAPLVLARPAARVAFCTAICRPPLLSQVPSYLLLLRKRRVRGLSEGERTARRRALHREIDATRRGRETAAFSRLQALLSPQAVTEQDADRRSAKSAGAGRVQVLELSAEALQQLQQLCTRQQQQLRSLAEQLHSVTAAQAQDALACENSPSPSSLPQCDHAASSASSSSSSSSSPLSAPPVPLLAALSSLHNSRSLRDCCSLGSPLCVLVKLMPSGVLVTASHRFCQQSGYREQELLGTTMTAVPKPGACPLLIQKADEKAGRPERVVPQYGRSGQQLLSLLSGEVERVEQTWRCVMADGRQYEVPACWSVRQPAHGRTASAPHPAHCALSRCCARSWIQPDGEEDAEVLRLVTVWSLQDAVQVDAAPPPPPQSSSSEAARATECSWPPRVWPPRRRPAAAR